MPKAATTIRAVLAQMLTSVDGVASPTIASQAMLLALVTGHGPREAAQHSRTVTLTTAANAPQLISADGAE